MNSKEALERLKDDIEINYLSTKHSNEKDKSNYLILLNSIEKDLEILEIFKNSMSVETVTFKNDNEVEKYEYEYIAFNDWNLDIKNKEDYNKIREWLKEK